MRDEVEVMNKLARFERKNSEVNYMELPSSNQVLDWRLFNTDMASTDFKYEKVKAICDNNQTKEIDLRPYMLEGPYTCMTTDKMQKILDIYRHHQLRQVYVLNPVDGSLQGIISREDLFNYMSLWY